MMDEAMERLLAYNGRRWWLTNGWSIWFRIWTILPSEGKPYGIRYSLTLHDVDGSRILAYDNAHSIPRQTEHDHRHAFRNIGRRAPYQFIDGDTLISDFIDAVCRACDVEGVAWDIDEEDRIGPSEEQSDDEENAQ